MELYDWLAILGATAWLPPIFGKIKKIFQRPIIRIITNKVIELGFTSCGPILNPQLAFTVENGNLVVTNFRIRVAHKDGEERIFEWHQLKQKIQEKRTSEGSELYEKEHLLFAIKLNNKDIEERTIYCQETSFTEGYNPIMRKVLEQRGYELKRGTHNPNEFLKGKEMNDLFTFCEQSICWKRGTYKIIFELESPEKFDLIDNEYEFTLLSSDIVSLEKNKNYIEQFYANEILPEEDFKKVNWNWCTLKIQKQ